MIKVVARGGYFVRERGLDYSFRITPVNSLSANRVGLYKRRGWRSEKIAGVECLVKEYDGGILLSDDIASAREQAYRQFKSFPTAAVAVTRVVAAPFI